MTEIKTIISREVLWDMELADRVNNVSLTMHHPVRKNVALECDAPWEGEHCGYGSLLYDGENIASITAVPAETTV